MYRKYYLEDEHLHSCDCVQKHGACDCEVSENGEQQHEPRKPTESEDLRLIRTTKMPVYSPPPSMSHSFQVRDGRLHNLKRYPPTVRKLNEAVSPLESHKSLYYTTGTQLEGAAVASKEILSGQFPCPCMSIDLTDLKTDDPCDVNFYNWWGWSWLKKRENDWRAKMESEGRRFSEEFPIALANYYTGEEYGRYQQEREVLPRRVPETERASYHDGCGSTKQKEKRRSSLLKTLNNAFKTITGKERKSARTCDCAKKLKICGPNIKPCGGLEGVLMPCGFDCDCDFEKKCLAPYMKDLCPCEKCRCPKENQYIPMAERKTLAPRRNPYLSMTDGKIPSQRDNHYIPMAEKRTRGRKRNQHIPMAERRIQAVSHSAPPLQSLDEFPEDDSWEGDYPLKNVHATNTEESLEIVSYRMQKVTPDKECCCSCDEELCQCCCCRDFQEVRSRKMQTSHCNLHEKCTQTDKVPRKCCRCCRCCSWKGKRECFQCIKDFPTHDNGSGGASPGNKHRSFTSLSSKCSRDKRVCSKSTLPGNHVTRNTERTSTNRQFNIHHSTSPTLAGLQIESSRSPMSANRHINVRSPPVINGHDTKRHDNSVTSPIISRQLVNSKQRLMKPVGSSCEHKKTTMVRTNSVQCIPARKNQATSYSYEDQYSSSQLDSFISQLHRQFSAEVFGRNDGDIDKPSIKLDADDINALTSAKLRNFFLEGDIYSSPVSGKYYDLSYRSVDEIPTTTSTKLFKPLGVNEQLQCSQFSMQRLTGEGEHTKLMTAICEAILSNQDNSGALEEPTREVNSHKVRDASGDSKQSKIEVLHTIKEDSESVNSTTSCGGADDGNANKSSEKAESENSIFEMQRSFKHKIDKLEEKIGTLMCNIQKGIGQKGKTEVNRNRSRSPPKTVAQDGQNAKKVVEYKPPITKTGLFGAIPSRSRLFAQNSTKVQHTSVKYDRDPVKNYEKLMQANQRHIDEVLAQLDALHDFDESRSPEGETTQSCGLEIKDSNKNFELDGEDENAGIIDKGDADERQNQKPLDFSSIRFEKCSMMDKISPRPRTQNYILQNLQSIMTSISDSYTIAKMIGDEETAERADASSTSSSRSSFVNTVELSVCNKDVDSKINRDVYECICSFTQ